MDSLERPGDRKAAWLDRLQALAEVILMAGFLSSLLAALPFAFQGIQATALFGSARLLAGYILLETSITLILLSLILRLNRQNLRDLGCGWEQWSGNIGLGVGLVPILFVANVGVSLFFSYFLPRYHLTHNPLIEKIQSGSDLMLFLIVAFIAGGIKEELQRAFILTRFREHLGGAKTGLVLWSIAFGAGHSLQGLQGSVTASLFGLLFGALYLARGSLLPPMTAHWLYDTAALLGYWNMK